MLEEPAEKFDGIELGNTLPGTSRFTIRKGHDAVLEGDDTAIGDSDPEDIGGEVFKGGGAVGIGLTMDIPGDVPDLWIDAVEEPGALHLLLKRAR